MGTLIVSAAVIAARAATPRRPVRERAYRRSNTGELSDQQVEILTLIESGRSYTQVGQRLHLTKGGVNNQLRRARQKLGVATTAEAVKVARERGLLGGENDGAQAA